MPVIREAQRFGKIAQSLRSVYCREARAGEFLALSGIFPTRSRGWTGLAAVMFTFRAAPGWAHLRFREARGLLLIPAGATS